MNIDTLDATIVMAVVVLGFIGGIARWLIKIHKDEIADAIRQERRDQALREALEEIRELKGHRDDHQP